MNAACAFGIGLDTPIYQLTPRQLFEMQTSWNESCAPKQAKPSRPEKWLVRNIEELAQAIQASPSTCYRMKKAGLLDSAISQFGRWMVIDVDEVLEIFRLSNIKKKRR
ncbi:MAG: DUF3853 family protein [Muribaculaceae bacterium]|nr:DUF3853 family protein [Muribaculaceae bacterium]